MLLQQPSRVGLSKVWMCEEPTAAADEPAAEEESSFDLESLSDANKEMLEQIKGMTLQDAAALIKDVEKTFNVGPKTDDDDEE